MVEVTQMYLQCVNLPWHDPKLQHHSSTSEKKNLSDCTPVEIPPLRSIPHWWRELQNAWQQQIPTTEEKTVTFSNGRNFSLLHKQPINRCYILV